MPLKVPSVGGGRAPEFLKGVNVSIDGKGYLGRAEEVELPKLTIKTEEYRGGGMDAPIELDMGMEKLECSVTLNEYDAALWAMWGLVPGNLTNITITGAFDSDGKMKQVLVNLTGSIKEIDMGSWKAGEKAALKLSLSCRYYALAIDGAPAVLIDIVNMKRVVGGKDMLADMRNALGA